MAFCKPGRARPGTESAGTLHFVASTTIRNTFLLLKPPSLCVGYSSPSGLIEFFMKETVVLEYRTKHNYNIKWYICWKDQFANIDRSIFGENYKSCPFFSPSKTCHLPNKCRKIFSSSWKIVKSATFHRITICKFQYSHSIWPQMGVLVMNGLPFLDKIYPYLPRGKKLYINFTFF